MSATVIEQDAPTVEAAVQTADDYAARVLQSALGAAETMAIYLGDRLGWYRSLATEGSATAAELADPHRNECALRPRVARAAGCHRTPRR